MIIYLPKNVIVSSIGWISVYTRVVLTLIRFHITIGFKILFLCVVATQDYPKEHKMRSRIFCYSLNFAGLRMKINAYSARKIWRILSLSQFIVCKYVKIWTVHNILILISQLQHISTFNKLRSILGKYSCCFIKVNSIQFVFHNDEIYYISKTYFWRKGTDRYQIQQNLVVFLFWKATCDCHRKRT